jgi:hypothetical protein
VESASYFDIYIELDIKNIADTVEAASYFDIYIEIDG